MRYIRNKMYIDNLIDYKEHFALVVYDENKKIYEMSIDKMIYKAYHLKNMFALYYRNGNYLKFKISDNYGNIIEDRDDFYLDTPPNRLYRKIRKRKLTDNITVYSELNLTVIYNENNTIHSIIDNNYNCIRYYKYNKNKVIEIKEKFISSNIIRKCTKYYYNNFTKLKFNNRVKQDISYKDISYVKIIIEDNFENIKMYDKYDELIHHIKIEYNKVTVFDSYLDQ